MIGTITKLNTQVEKYLQDQDFYSKEIDLDLCKKVVLKAIQLYLDQKVEKKFVGDLADEVRRQAWGEIEGEFIGEIWNT